VMSSKVCPTVSMKQMKQEVLAMLPEGLGVQEGEPPPLPEDFERGFVLPEHYEKPLQRVHSHALDSRLTFYAGPHVYTLDGVPTSDSVTSQAHRFETDFDGPAAIQSMKMSKRQAWPRLEYALDTAPFEGEVLPGDMGVMAVQDGKTISVCHRHNMAPGASLLPYLRSAMVKGVDWDEDEVELFSFSRGMEETEILKRWSDNATILCNKGTYAHYMGELLMNGMPTRECGEMDVLVDFCRRYLIPRGIVAYNTEKEIVCRDADLAGSIDLIVFDAERGIHHLVDYKRSDKLESQLRGFGSKKMKRPLNHLADCKGAGYALQLSLYQYILERDYGMTIGDRVLVSLHPEHPFSTSVPYLREEVAYIMECRYKLVAARRAVVEAHPNMVCGLCGGPLVDAVRLEDGTLAMEKMAQVRDLPYSPDESTRAAFAELVDTMRGPDPPLGGSKRNSWNDLMPTSGLGPFEGW